MKLLVDTSVWSHFLRRRKPETSPSLETLRQAIRERKVQMVGIVRQELLSGIGDQNQYNRVAAVLASFPDLLAETADHIRAAEFFNACRKHGIQGSPVDFLICAQASRHRLRILTEDKDFPLYARHLPIELV